MVCCHLRFVHAFSEVQGIFEVLGTRNQCKCNLLLKCNALWKMHAQFISDNALYNTRNVSSIFFLLMKVILTIVKSSFLNEIIHFLLFAPSFTMMLVCQSLLSCHFLFKGCSQKLLKLFCYHFNFKKCDICDTCDRSEIYGE